MLQQLASSNFVLLKFLLARFTLLPINRQICGRWCRHQDVPHGCPPSRSMTDHPSLGQEQPSRLWLCERPGRWSEWCQTCKLQWSHYSSAVLTQLHQGPICLSCQILFALVSSNWSFAWCRPRLSAHWQACHSLRDFCHCEWTLLLQSGSGRLHWRWCALAWWLGAIQF